MRTLLTTVFCALAALMAMTSTAGAQPSPVGNLEAEFRDIAVFEGRGGRLNIEYKISKRSWRQMRDAGIQPSLNIYSPDRRGGKHVFRYNVPLASRADALRMPRTLDIGRARTVELKVVGFSGPNQMRWVSVAGNPRDSRIRVEVERTVSAARPAPSPSRPIYDNRPDPVRPPPARPAPRPGATRAQIIEACGNATKFDSEFNRCVERAQALDPVIAAGVVDACARGTQFDSEFNKCLVDARGLRANPVGSIEACGKATKFNSEFRRCVKGAATFVRNPAPVIRACSRATSFDSEFNKCLVNSEAIRGNTAAIIDSCAASTNFDSEFQKCLKISASGPRQRGNTGFQYTTY